MSHGEQVLIRKKASNLVHPATEAEHQVEGGLLLDVVVGEGAPVLELLASED
eukprot:CAMPEP_0113241266 /NCGR_PEP_ID=MMETSP0008_2-20120614/6707_1 /TAXON_ID=97485 /ORGANISM="Prymnesium parvum" /LENGTH=51 /DNA_ID=CAMNT_0000088667 /DNA_START=185 /DNA_END=337 /DNA_ORIENTATION=+ /assembly_acc=CAM_ASM_000153